jgi:hypothetical protein
MKGLLVILSEWLNVIYFFHTPSLSLVCVILPINHRKNRANTDNLSFIPKKSLSSPDAAGVNPIERSLLRQSTAIFDTSTHVGTILSSTVRIECLFSSAAT